MRKLVCLGLSCILLLSLLVGCGFKGPGSVVKDIIDNKGTDKSSSDVSNVPDVSVESTEDTKGESEVISDGLLNSADLQNKKLYSFLSSFVSYLSEDSVDTNILTYFHIPKDSYISVSDIEWLLPRIKFDNLVGCDVTTTDIEQAIDTLGDGTTYSITLKTSSKVQVPLTVVLNNDNDFKVSLSENLISNYMIKFPTFGEVQIDGVVIPENYLSLKDELGTTYTFGGIVVREHTYSYNNDILGDLSVSLVPVESKDIQSGEYVLSSIEGKAYLPIVKDLWNNIISTSLSNKGNTSSIKKFFISNFDDVKLSTYVNDLDKYLKFKEGTTPIMTDIDWVSSVESRVISDNSVSVCIKYRIEFVGPAIGSQSMRDVARVDITKENDVWVLRHSSDTFLDNEFNWARDNWDKY